MSSDVQGYGAIKTAEEGGADRSFDADNLRFLPEADANLTRVQRIRKYLLVAIPILVAIIVVGGAGLFLYRDFNHLYPGPGGDSSGGRQPARPIQHRTPSGPTPSASRTPPTMPSPPSTPTVPSPPSVPTPPTTKKTTGDAACSAHPNCVADGLIGDCCPSSGGIFLNCC